jgi:hypothetical protein
MLSTALRERGASDSKLYRASHRHHPCTLWAGESRANAEWLILHARAIGDQWRLRYGRERLHASEPVIDRAESLLGLLPAGSMTPYAQAMPPEYRRTDAVIAYRAYYRGVKGEIAAWRLGTPDWWWQA